MGALSFRMREIVDGLEAAGVRATGDPRSINPPCVLVLPPSIPVMNQNCGGGDAVHTVLVIGPPPANLDSWEAIDDLAELAGRVIPVEALAQTSYQADENSALMPALQLTWTHSLEWPTPEGT